MSALENIRKNLKKRLENMSFRFFLLFSLGIHFILIFFFIVGGNLFALFKKKQRIVVPPSVRVDMVALPDFPAVKKAKKKKEKPVLISDKKEKKKAPPKQKKKKKITKSKKKPDDKLTKAKKKPEKEPLKKAGSDSKKKINKGNKLSQGVEKGKEVLNAQQQEEINAYFLVISDRIRAFWNLPKYITEQSLTAEIEIKINNKGEMTYKNLDVSSGNDLFDSRVLKAMESAAPYPPPPSNVQSLIRNGIILRLSSRDEFF